MQTQGEDDNNEPADYQNKLRYTSFKIILLNILVSLIGLWCSPSLNYALGVPVIGLYFILALFSAIVSHNVLSCYKPNTLSFVKDVLISTL